MFALASYLLGVSSIILFVLLAPSSASHILQQSEETLRINLKTGKVLGFSEYIHFEELVSNNRLWNQSTLYSGKKGRNQQQGLSDYEVHEPHKKTCAMQALLKIDLNGPFSSLKFQLHFNRPKLWTFHLSQTSHDFGFGKILPDAGGPSSQSPPSSPSLQIHNRQLSLYGASTSSAGNHVFPDPSSSAELLATSPVLLAVRDDAMPRRAKSTVAVTLEHKNLKWDLKPDSPASKLPPSMTAAVPPQPGTTTKSEDDVTSTNNWQLQSEQLFDFHSHNSSYLYVGLNRAVGAVYKYGAGLCEVTIVLQRAREKRDECTGGNHTCDFNAECKDMKNSFRCVCKPGFKGSGHVCQDENECDFLNGHCVQMCTNTEGSHYCSCYGGFELAANKRDCLDIDECQNDNGLCEHTCENTVGSYRCTCRQGFVLAADGYSCISGEVTAGDICSELGCAHGCNEARRLCYCKTGYKLHPNGKDCTPTCEMGNGGCQHKCFDTDGGPICGCHPDYFLSMDNRTCLASCAIDNGGCERLCENTPTGVRCLCPSGYRLSKEDNKTCNDVDECRYRNGGCQFDCVNTFGTYECHCPSGYLLDPDQRSCVDIDECAFNETCQHECINMPGSYECKCRNGYHMYADRFCADIDECSDDNGGCQQGCTNTLGSYACTCQPGYQLHYNGKDCYESKCNSSIISSDMSPATVRFDPRSPAAFLSCHAHRYSSFFLAPSVKFSFQCSSNRCQQRANNNNNEQQRTNTIEIRTLVETCDVEATTDSSIRRFARDGDDNCSEAPYYLCSVDVSCEQVSVRGSRKPLSVLTIKGVLSENRSVKDSHISQFRAFTFIGKWKQAAFSDLIRFHHHGVTYTIKSGLGDSQGRSQRSWKDEEDRIAPLTVRCDPGTYYNTSYGFCLPCSKGTYQSEADSLYCAPCPASYSTVIGASKLQDCAGNCDAGQFSQTGLEPCTECPMGTYQSDNGRTQCKPCGGRLSTMSTGARSFGECSAKAICHEGYYYDMAKDDCVACPLGTYQSRTGQNFCTRCPVNMTTDHVGSTVLEQCKYKYCRSRIGRLGGFLESANYPNDYPNNAACTWVLRAPKHHRLLIFIPELQLAADRCRDYLVMRKNASPYSAITFEGCESYAHPIALIARSRRLWIQFRTDDRQTAKGFHLRYVAYQEQDHALIEDIVRDSRLYTDKKYKAIFDNPRFLEAFIDVISEPNNYRKYMNITASSFPRSFLDILWPKIQRFFDLGDNY